MELDLEHPDMMNWLLKFDGYPPGVVFALILHGFLLYILLPSKNSPADFLIVEPQTFVSATVIKENPQRLRRIEELEQQRQQQRTDQQRERNIAREQEQKKEKDRVQQENQLAETQRKKEAEIRAQQQQEKDAAAKKEETAKRESARKESERLQQIARAQAAQQDAAKQAADQAQAQSAQASLVSQYAAKIKEIIQMYWNIPENSPNGMTAVIRLVLTPTGEVITSEIVQSSGNDLFDRSILSAVKSAESFPELQDLPPKVFDENFRRINLQFIRPEKLIQ